MLGETCFTLLWLGIGAEEKCWGSRRVFTMSRAKLDVVLVGGGSSGCI